MANKKKLWKQVRPYSFGFAAGVFLTWAVFAVIGGSDLNGHTKKTATFASTSCPKARMPQSIAAPLLPPPEFSDELPDIIEAQNNGEADLAWKPVPKALSYIVVITDTKGHHVNAIKTPFSTITVKDLRTGNGTNETHFLASVATINIDGRAGQRNKPREIVVKDRPDITAPTIKSIKTED